MIDTSIVRSGSASRQAELWGRRARDWSHLAEGLMHAFFAEVLTRLHVGPGVAILDVGCGSGVAAALGGTARRASQRVRCDPRAPGNRSAARSAGGVTPRRDEQLPYLDAIFDVVTGFNAFQYAANPVKALTEARRVTRRGGTVMMATWGRAERVAMAPVFRAVASLLPPPAPGSPGPFALSHDSALATLARQAGLQPEHEDRFTDRWHFPDIPIAVRTVLSAGPMSAAIEHAGEARVSEAVAKALEMYGTTAGGYQLDNEFLYLIARA